MYRPLELLEPLFLSNDLRAEYAQYALYVQLLDDSHVMAANLGVLHLLGGRQQIGLSLQSDDVYFLKDMERTLDEAFVVEHFGGDVDSSVSDFVKQSAEAFPAELICVFVESGNRVLAEVAKLSLSRSAKQTTSQRFKAETD